MQQSGKWFSFVLEDREGQGVIWDVATAPRGGHVMDVEENGAVLDSWKEKSPVAGVTQTFLHPPSVLILNFICSLT